MAETQAGVMALAMASSRAFHATHESPKIFDDFLADALFTPQETAELNQQRADMLKYVAPELAATNPDPLTAMGWMVQLTAGPLTLSRSRYTEDRLEETIAQGVRQYVILGAGFDTFAYRRPDLAGRVEVFSVDHPATQALMLQRAAAAGWAQPANLHSVATDFTQESLADALKRAPYDPNALSFFSWLGVSYYLAREVVFEALRGIASISGRGSTLVFDYMDPDAFDPNKSGRRLQQMIRMAEKLGEPMKSGFDPLGLAADLDRLGLRIVENLSPDNIEARYFQGRSDRYHAFEHAHFATAIVR